MSRYVLLQEQLDQLLGQIKNLNQLNEIKEERIRELERDRILLTGTENVTFVSTIARMEDEIRDLKTSNRALTEDREKSYKKIQDLETLLEEERKLREYSEAFAKEVELQCAEESMIRELTAELCKLQKDEIEIESKRILQLQNKIKKLAKGGETVTVRRRSSNKNDKENFQREVHLRATVERLRGQFLEIYDQMKASPTKGPDDHKQRTTLKRWIREIPQVLDELDDIHRIRSDLSRLKYEIEDRRKSFF